MLPRCRAIFQPRRARASIAKMITIHFLSGLKEFVGKHELRMHYCGSLSALLEKLGDRYGEAFCQCLFDPCGKDRRNPFLKILIDGVDVQGADPDLAGDETVFLFLPIAGG
ncbi:MAG: MoaD/ThiS family protein [bacterium]